MNDVPGERDRIERARAGFVADAVIQIGFAVDASALSKEWRDSVAESVNKTVPAAAYPDALTDATSESASTIPADSDFDRFTQRYRWHGVED